jgi:hypothetical protein
MTLRPEYSLGHSEYNAFLFAAVGEEKVGLPLTVLTALTRLGFDPWREAARLSDLPKETATRAFAVTIAMLPEGDWKASESEAIAARLVNWLPRRSTVAIPLVVTAPTGGERMKAGFATWLVWGVLRPALYRVVSLGALTISNSAEARTCRRRNRSPPYAGSRGDLWQRRCSTPIGVRRVMKLPDRWEADKTGWPTLGGGEEGEIDALDLLQCRREARD